MASRAIAGTRSRFTTVLWILGCLATQSSPAPAQDYTLGGLANTVQFKSAAAHAISPSGVVAGTGLLNGSQISDALIFNAPGLKFLSPLPGDAHAFALAINDSQMTVGTSLHYLDFGEFQVEVHRGVVWENGTAIELSTRITNGPSFTIVTASGVNSSGTIVGFGEPASLYWPRGYRFHDGSLSILPSLPSQPHAGSRANSINDYGTIVGWATSSELTRHAVRWTNDQPVDLHAEAMIAGDTSEALDVNRFDHIVGWAEFGYEFPPSAALWKDGRATDLGSAVPPSFFYGSSRANAINDLGIIVGQALWSDYQNQACIWRDGKFDMLSTLVISSLNWRLLEARDISNDGQIVGLAKAGNKYLPFRLIPTCDGKYELYGAPCPTSGVPPKIAGFGCPEAGGISALEVTGGEANGLGLLCVGVGTNTGSIAQGCSLQVLSLAAQPIEFQFDSLGRAFFAIDHPLLQSYFGVHYQALFPSSDAPSGIAGTQPLAAQGP